MRQEFARPLDMADRQMRAGRLGRPVDMARTDMPPPSRWVVENRMPIGQTTIFSGQGGDGKSFLMFQLAVACALGATWLDLPVRRCRALYFACEDDDDKLFHRAHAIARYHGHVPGDLEDLLAYSACAQDNELVRFKKFEARGEPTDLYGKLEVELNEFGPELVVLDSSHDLFLGNEIDRGQVRTFVRHITMLAQSYDCAVVLIAHPSRSGIKEGTGQSGSTAWFNSVRSFFHVSTKAVNGPRAIVHTKNQYGPLSDDLLYEWSDDHGVFVRCDMPSVPRSASLSPGDRLAWRTMTDWFAEVGNDAMPFHVFRDIMVSKGHIENPDNRANFTRLRKKFQAGGLITINDQRIRLVKDHPAFDF